jgi:hypothetical protein
LKPSLKRLVSQPLFHFLLIGSAVFGVYHIVNPAANDKETIVIDDEMVGRVSSLFQKQWGRMPTDDEWKSLIDNELREEVYYRQALKMNLDHNDMLIRRRMNQKLDFITSDLVQMKTPADTVLQAYYSTQKEKYLRQARFTFSHIYFNADKRPYAKADALECLPSLPSTDEKLSELARLGDVFPFAYHTDDASAKDIDAQMGDGFSTALAGLPVGKWSGPVLSGFGAHLVYISGKKPASEPAFASIREQLLNDYRYEYQQKFNRKVYEDFKKEYTFQTRITDPKTRQLIMGLTETDAP